MATYVICLAAKIMEAGMIAKGRWPMKNTKNYAKVHAEYVRRFHSQPPSILTEESALELMQKALEWGTPISERDLSPDWPPA